MNEIEIKSGDILYFRNGDILEYGENQWWILQSFYNENLECVANAEFSIDKIIRSKVGIVYQRGLIRQMKI